VGVQSSSCPLIRISIQKALGQQYVMVFYVNILISYVLLFYDIEILRVIDFLMIEFL
jgi:hypothetical protein